MMEGDKQQPVFDHFMETIREGWGAHDKENEYGRAQQLGNDLAKIGMNRAAAPKERKLSDGEILKVLDMMAEEKYPRDQIFESLNKTPGLSDLAEQWEEKENE